MATLSRADRSPRIEIEPQHVEPVPRTGMDPLVIDRLHQPPGQLFEHDVLADREARDQIALLVDHADAERHGVAGVEQADLFAAHDELALVGPVDAGDDLDERRLAGAVLAEQRVDRALGERQRHTLEGFDPREELAHMASFEGDLRHDPALVAAFCRRTSRQRLTPTAHRINAPSTTWTR